MVLIITQETFNEAVQENINDLGLSPEEAVSDAVAQFQAQGVDLSNVITEVGGCLSFQNISDAVKKLAEFQDKQIAPPCSDLLLKLKLECDKGIQYRVQAGKLGAYNVILEILLKSEPDTDLKLTALKTMLSLMTKQPDLLDDKGVAVIISNLNNSHEMEVVKLVLKWCKECCVMHEINRQHFIEANIVNDLSKLLQDANSSFLREVLSVLRALILDDDVRVEFGRAHEHARIIASETLVLINELMKKFKCDSILTNDLMLTLSAMLVRTEFCTTVDEAGGIDTIRDVMTACVEDDKIIRQCFKIIKALAGNDECKKHVIQKGLAPVIYDSLNAHKRVVLTVTAGLGCVAALSLRDVDNSKALFEASIPEVVVEIMQNHPDEKSVQKTASWAIRNMVSRSRYQNAHFLELGIEELLHRNLAKFKEFEYDTKAALRDLDCDVELKEEWTGRGGKITSETALLK